MAVFSICYKCSLLNAGHVPVTADYHLAGSVLITVEYCRDLDVMITCRLSMSRHIGEITSKARHVNYILLPFTYGDKSLLIRLKFANSSIYGVCSM